MIQSSYFQQLAYLITVQDICSAFIATLDVEDLVEDVNETWVMVWCGHRLDPMEQLALVARDQELWYGYQPTISRHWNAFGTSRREPRPESALNIICEINIPHKGRDKSVQGVFVTDRTDNGNIYIAHQGKLTITARKVRNIGFIDWVRSQPGYDQYLVDILWDEGIPEKTEAILVSDLSNPLFLNSIKVFVLMANKYKEVIQGVTHKKSTD